MIITAENKVKGIALSKLLHAINMHGITDSSVYKFEQDCKGACPKRKVICNEKLCCLTCKFGLNLTTEVGNLDTD